MISEQLLQDNNNDSSSSQARLPKAGELGGEYPNWLKNLELPVDLEDLVPVPSPILESIGLASKSLYYYLTTTTSGKFDNAKGNNNILNRDGKALLKFSAWTCPIRSEFKRKMQDRFNQLSREEKEASAHTSKTSSNQQSSSLKFNGSNIQEVMADIKVRMETEELGNTSEDEEKLWDADLKRERKIKRMLRRAKEEEKKNNAAHGHHHHNHDHEHNDHEHNDHSSQEKDPNLNDSIFRKTLIRKQDSKRDPHFPLLLNKKFTCPLLEAATLALRHKGQKAIFIADPSISSSLLNLEVQLRQSAPGSTAAPLSKCAAQFMQMQAQYPDLFACQGMPIELHLEVCDIHFYGDEGKGELRKNVEPGLEDWRKKEIWHLTLPEKWQSARVQKENGNQRWSRGDSKGSIQAWEFALSCLESIKALPDYQDWRQDLLRGENASPILGDPALTPLDFDLLFEQLSLNLSLAYLKTREKLDLAIKLCTQLLTSNPDNVKARFRRARAYRLNGRDLDLALEDLKVLIRGGSASRDPAIQEEYELVVNLLKQNNKQQKAIFERVFNTTKE